MTALLPGQRRAEKFAALVDATSTGAAGAPYASLLEVVGSLHAAAAAGPSARPDYVSDLRARLMAEADTALVPTDRRLQLDHRTTTTRRQGRVAAATAGLVLVGSGAGMAMAAQTSLPGQSLYPLKRGIEQAGAAMSFSDAARGRDLLNQASTRLDEVDALLADGDQAEVSHTLGSFTHSAAAGADLLLTQYQADGKDASVATVHSFAVTQMNLLSELADKAPASLRPDFADAAALVADLDQQAGTLCASCGGAAPLAVPDNLESATAARSLSGLLGTGSQVTATGRRTATVPPNGATGGVASATPSAGAIGQQPSATDTTGIVVPPLSAILGADPTAAAGGSPDGSAGGTHSGTGPGSGLVSGLGTGVSTGLDNLLGLKVPSAHPTKAPTPGKADPVTKKVKGALKGLSGSVRKPTGSTPKP